MYIEPNTNIRILKGVPLDPSYEHTIYFGSATAQSDYFKSKTKHNLSSYTYQRVKRGYARIGLPADEVYDCNYMMFQNAGFGAKWFYAFITSVEYVNNQCTEIEFEIDDMQTWFFDYTLGMNFVEREHSETDEIGDNINPEPVNGGEYVFSSQDRLDTLVEPMNNDMCVIVATVEVDPDTTTDVYNFNILENGSPIVVDGNTYDGVYSGAKLVAFNAHDVSYINSYIDNYKLQPNSIIGMYMCPKWLINYDDPIPNTGYVLPYGASGRSITALLSPITEQDTFGNYIPKNKKLYTYPFNYFAVLNGTGKTLALRYEFFKDRQPALNVYGTISEPVQMVCKPYNYKGLNRPEGMASADTYTVHEEHIECNSYPTCSWNMDYYSSWKAQNSIPIALNGMAGVMNTFSNLSTTGMLANSIADTYRKGTKGRQRFEMRNEANKTMAMNSAVSSGVSEVANLMTQYYSASIHADLLNGSYNNGGADTSKGFNTFFVSRVHITEQVCKCIDDFFTKFGYTTNRVKIPNRNARPHWNYVKTVSCTLEANSLPADAENNICEIYNRGITFWKSGDEVGNYSLDNSI